MNAFSPPKEKTETAGDYFWNQIMFCKPSSRVVEVFATDILRREFNYKLLMHQAELIMGGAN